MKNLTIQQKLYDLMKWFFPIVDNFPKYEKFVLCTQIKNLVLEISKLIIEANKSKSKVRFLNRIDVKIEQLRMLIRFAHDRKYLSHKKYENVSKKIDEIGRMLGGWIKSCL
ncbi:diversity-generating retroelement protein Avd [Halanaerobium saccharolyticum]